ncbi:MAG TPA: ABC transporter substrate-binding protein [Streptosporangiaceae bacterium]|nr:ABC transporter substrate-binding protein [Streptosporangiaceae bacterium]
MQHRPIVRRALSIAGAAAVLAVAACSSSSTSAPPASGGTSSTAAAGAGMGSQPLVVESAEQSPLTETFNPLTASQSTGWTLHADDLMYEPLFLFNLMQPSQAPVPMLATAYSWSPDGKTLTLTTRTGVKWTDGQPFSAADVAFTFNLIKQYAATADVNGTPAPASATATGPNTVMITFPAPAAGSFYAIGSQQIVSQHIWQSVGDPSKYADAHPVGTGPYVLSSFSPQKVTFKFNPKYWNESAIHVPEVIFPGFATGTSTAAVTSGQVDWAGNDIPNVQSVFTGASPSNHLWLSSTPYFAANNVVTMWFNTTKAPLNDPKVRQAVAYAINRQQLATQGESGYEAPATSSSGLLPSYQAMISPQYNNDLAATGDPAKAASILTSDGWTKTGGKWMKNGQTLKFTVKDPSDFTDYFTDCQLIARQLDAQGFDVTAVGEAGGYVPWNTDVQNGNFDATLHWSAGPIPYNNFQNWVDQTATAPIGTAASGNWGRFKDPAAQAALNQLAAATTSSTQQSALNSLQQVFATQVPETPVLYGALWAEWSTKNYTGWPSPSNPYSDPGPTNNQDVEFVLLHLAPAS